MTRTKHRPTAAEMKRMPRPAPCPVCESEAVEGHSYSDEAVVRCCDCGISLHGPPYPTERLDKHTRSLARALRINWLVACKREAQVMLIQRWNALPRPDTEHA